MLEINFVTFDFSYFSSSCSILDVSGGEGTLDSIDTHVHVRTFRHPAIILEHSFAMLK